MAPTQLREQNDYREDEIRDLKEELRQVKGRFIQGQHLSRLGIWDWDLRTDQTWWYGQMFAIYGIDESEFTGKGQDYLDFTHPSDKQIQLQNIQNDIKKTVKESEMTNIRSYITPDPKEFRIIQKNGQICWVRGDAVTVVDENLQPLRMLGTLIDITKEKELEQELLKAQNLEPFAIMQSEVIHELKNALFIISGLIHTIDRNNYEQSFDQHIETMDNTITRAVDILNTSRKMINNYSKEVSDFDPGIVLMEILEMMLLIHKDIEFNTSISKHFPKITGNPGQYYQIFSNLIINAIDAVKSVSNPSIEIGLRYGNCGDCYLSPCQLFNSHLDLIGCLEFNVLDTGTGIKKENINKVFEPFFTTKAKGTGLGLSIVKSIVDGLGGIIEIESKIHWTLFNLMLPILSISTSTDNE